MKLLTTMSAKGTRCGSIDEYAHDAAAAHALLQALDEYEEGGECWDFTWIELRAADLMAEWGFSSIHDLLLAGRKVI
jgi:hypothetical protein